jgi:hypothetical protein
MMKNILCIMFFAGSSLSTKAQPDSSSVFTQIITGGSSKSWYTRPAVIVDNPGDLRYSTLTFALSERTGSITKPGGPDALSSFRNLHNWKVKKEADKYILELSSTEKYFISFASGQEKILILESLPRNRRRIVSISGHFFESPFHLK